MTSTAPNIRYLKREDIDPVRWDNCITRSPNGWLYMRSFFLDSLGPWDALITPDDSGDYNYVMPLPKKKKFGITYSWLPPLCGQLGIVGAAPIPATLVAGFLRSIPPSFRLVHTLLNEQNTPPDIPGIGFHPRRNLVLPLNSGYTELHAHYNADAKKNLRQAYAKHLEPEYGIPMATVASMYKAAYGEGNRAYFGNDYRRVTRLCEVCIANGYGFTLGIRDPQQNIQAAAFFGLDEKRVYYLLGAPGPEGRRFNAVHCLIDQVIKRYAGSGLELDFEGSDIASVAAFYQKFNPLVNTYYEVKFNRFPQWMQRFL